MIPALGDVQCVLRKRGLTWYVEPVGPPGHLKLEGRDVSGARSLPLGVALQVGSAWLTIQTERRERAGFEPRAYEGRPLARPAVSPMPDLSPPSSTVEPRASLEPRAGYGSARLSSDGGEQRTRLAPGSDRLSDRSATRPGYSIRGREPAQTRRPSTLPPVPAPVDRPSVGLSSGGAFREQPVTPVRPVARLHESLREAITRVKEERQALRRAASEVERPVRGVRQRPEPQARDTEDSAQIVPRAAVEQAVERVTGDGGAKAWLMELLDRPRLLALPAPVEADLAEVQVIEAEVVV